MLIIFYTHCIYCQFFMQWLTYKLNMNNEIEQKNNNLFEKSCNILFFDMLKDFYFFENWICSCNIEPIFCCLLKLFESWKICVIVNFRYFSFNFVGKEMKWNPIFLLSLIYDRLRFPEWEMFNVSERDVDFVNDEKYF